MPSVLTVIEIQTLYFGIFFFFFFLLPRNNKAEQKMKKHQRVTDCFGICAGQMSMHGSSVHKCDKAI